MRPIDPLYVGVGGFVGAVLRWGVGVLVPGAPGTLVVNVLGSVALGALVAVAPSHRTRVLVGTGLLSSFTTYSTFAVETALTPEWAAANVLASYALGFGGVLLARQAVAVFERRGHRW